MALQQRLSVKRPFMGIGKSVGAHKSKQRQSSRPTGEPLGNKKRYGRNGIS